MSVSIEDFSLLSVIGKGTYAKVLLVRHKKSEQVYAMKVLKKKYIAEKKQELHIQTQRDVLANLEHPFLMKLYYSFQDAKKLYFVLEYCPGGELFKLLQIQQKFKLTEDQTRFYAAQMVLALEYLHSKNVLYRDLKPENVLIDSRGYIKLTDFGLSKILTKTNDIAKSVCGTPEYLAPEIIDREGHGKMVDWWCLGCIIFEMVTGNPPFNNQNRFQLFEDIRYNEPDLSGLSPKLQNILKGLFIKNPNKRLGINGAAEIKKNSWFEKINWAQLQQKSTKAPYIPTIKSKTDTSNFDTEFTSTQVSSLKGDEEQTTDIKYKDFSFEQQTAKSSA